jgi:hypothetical protein
MKREQQHDRSAGHGYQHQRRAHIAGARRGRRMHRRPYGDSKRMAPAGEAADIPRDQRLPRARTIIRQAQLQSLIRRVGDWGDRLIVRLFVRPWLLQVVALVLALLYLAWSFVGATAVRSTTRPPMEQERPLPVLPGADMAASAPAVEPLQVVAAYNAASIAAGRTGDVTVLYPFLTPTGAAKQAVQAEFERRSQRLEMHAPELVRWGLVRSDVSETQAMVETQEVWNDQTLIGGVVTGAERNMIFRHTYHLLRQDPTQPWLIERVDTMPVVR